MSIPYPLHQSLATATSTDPARQNLACILTTPDGRAIASDGHILAIRSLPAEHAPVTAECIPATAPKVARKDADRATVRAADGMVTTETRDGRQSSASATIPDAASYPDTTAVIRDAVERQTLAHVVCLDAGLLAKLAKALDAPGNAVTLLLPQDPGAPIVVMAGHGNQDCSRDFGLLMPHRPGWVGGE